MSVFGYVYIITNSVNHKVYIGITRITIKKRWAVHKCNAKWAKKRTHLCLAMSKYGHEVFTIKKLKTCFSPEQLYASEVFFIKQYKSTNREFGYNNSIGGEVSTLGFKHSAETKKLMSEKNKGRKPNSGSFRKGEHRCGGFIPGNVPPLTAETRRKISLALKGKKVSEEVREKIRKTLTGRKNGPLSKETRKKISIANTGKSLSKNHIEKLRVIHTGNKYRKGKAHSEETKSKISNTKKGSIWSEKHRENRRIAFEKKYNKTTLTKL